MSAAPRKAIPPPLRFLALVIGGWICLRAAILAPAWWERGGGEEANRPAAVPGFAARFPQRTGEEAAAVAAPLLPALEAKTPSVSLIRHVSYKTLAPPPVPGPVRPLAGAVGALAEEARPLAGTGRPFAGTVGRLAEAARPLAGTGRPLAGAVELGIGAVGPGIGGERTVSVSADVLPRPSAVLPAMERFVGALEGAARPPLLPPPAATGGRRWSGAAWLLVRHERGGASLAPGGTLGGSQAGGRVLYRLGDGLALSGRGYAPLRRTKGAEAAAGLDWRPVAAIPVNLVAERRQALGREGRSAFAIAAYGGASRALPGGLRLEAYFQAGLVGLRSRGAFVDGAARISAPIGPVEIGAGAWGGAQPGAARLDAGPSLSYALPVAGAHLRLHADWRLRLAGDAAPGSGPALTLAADF